MKLWTRPTWPRHQTRSGSILRDAIVRSVRSVRFLAVFGDQAQQPGVVADLNIWKGRTRSARHFDTTHNSVASLQLQSCTFRCRFIAPRGNANCPTFRASERLLKSATQKFRATPIRSHLDLVDGTGQIGCKERTDSIHPVEKTRLNLPV